MVRYNLAGQRVACGMVVDDLMGDVIRLADYKVAMLETSLGKVGRDSDGIVLRPTLLHKADDSGKAEVVKIFWRGRKPRRMGPAKVLEFMRETGG